MDCIATLSTKKSYCDLKILLKSISIFSPTIKIYIIGDTYICNICKIDFPQLNIITISGLDKYTLYNREELEKMNLWLEFMLEKCTIVDYALTENKNVLFLDADIILFNPIETIISPENLKKDMGLSKHLINNFEESLYGLYNGGFFYISNKNITPWWRKTSKSSTFYEQKAMDNIPLFFDCFFIEPQNNFGWWRLFQAPNPQATFNKFRIQNNMIFYDNKPLNSIHTHLISTFPYTVEFNKIIMKFVELTNNNKLKEILEKN
jgi:hypothetical protein